eukprot:gene9902-10759_t
MTGADFKYSSVPFEEDVESAQAVDRLEVVGDFRRGKIDPSLKTKAALQKVVPLATSSGPSQQGSTDQPSLLLALTGWISMILALIAGASIGPAFRYIMVHNVPPILGVVWRSQTMILTLLPFAVIERFANKDNQVTFTSYKPDLPYPLFVHMFIAGTFWAGGLLLWVLGLRFISTYKASVIATCHPILLVVFLRLTGKEVSMYEWVGVFVAFSGVLVSNFSNFIEGDSAEDPTMAADMSKVPIHLQMVGFFLCILAAASEVGVIINRIKTRKYVPLLQYTVGTTFVVFFYAIITSITLEKIQIFDISSDSVSICYHSNCIFGWLSHYWRWRMLVFGLWVGAVCITGFNYAMSYIPALVFSSLSLLDPTITAVLSWVLSLEGLPTIYSWLGGVVVIVGVSIIMYGEKQREKEPVKDSTDEAEVDNEETSAIELKRRGMEKR